ncbi:hypothetical protein JJB09_04390 [Rhizobium sp. KVB221]|uniref:Uncharacterized protein n=1 Tax=Rhizobium setariae TaxID=2801340 RepID=A0A936YJ82_9HYPH|nr:hypothetical protein [Rhizobium setariae]MBL0371260.1 hypothetical protein [Rhizobium setariae]
MRTLHTGLEGHEALFVASQRQASHVLAFHRRHSRFLRFVDSHQKWMLMHMIADTCAGSAEGVAANWICERAQDIGIASRNTTLAFFGQLAAYGYLVRRECDSDKRMKLVALSRETEKILGEWVGVQLAGISPVGEITLDDDVTLRHIYLRSAGRLVGTPSYVRPPIDVGLMQDIRGGWLVMNDLLTHIDPTDCCKDSIAVSAFSIAQRARDFAMSRSTIYRLFRLAEEAAILGWEGEQGSDSLKMSGYHLRQYCRWNGRLLQIVCEAAQQANDNCRQTGTGYYFPQAAAGIRAPATRLL